MAGLSLRIIPNSSSNSGSALVVPRIKRLKESVKFLPKATEALLAAVANSVNWVPDNPAAEPMAVADAAS